MKSEDKERILEEVISRALQDKVQCAFSGKVPLERTINDTIYHERQRLESSEAKKSERGELQYWKQINRRLLDASEEEQKKILKEIVSRFANEIVGHFNPKLYSFVSRVLPKAISMALNLISPRVWLSHFPRMGDISKLIVPQGEVAMLQKLSKIGTILLVPTHSSNMDSIVVGLALYKMGLPPFTYGAGLNLFQSSPFLIRYFMRNLGAYKVDRKKKSTLYKDILKEYATAIIEAGYHNLFFPGGTRSRSGELESHLKLGLLGTGITAYIDNLQQGKPKPSIFVVPCTISYQLVLEAQRLVEDFLKETGKSRYIIEDDEFSQPRKILHYITGSLRLDSCVYVTVCPAMDLFGNRVDEDGVSYDKRGRPVDIGRYVMIDGQVEHDTQRDQQYIRELGSELQESYRRHNVAMSVHLVAFAVHQTIVAHNPEMDLYRILRTAGKEDNFPVRDICVSLEKLVAQIKKMAAQNEIRLDERLANASSEAILEEALRHFLVYHSRTAMFRRGDRIYPNDAHLIYYYHNRLQGYGLEKHI